MNASFSELAKQGLWSNNPAMVQLLGLCPLLAVSSTFANSLGLGIATLVVLTCSNLMISIIRRLLIDSIRLPAQILVIATFVTLADLVLQAWFFELHQRIGLFVALIVTNCALLGRAEAFASRNRAIYAAFDGLMMGLGFLIVILALGSVRELLGHGSLFRDLQLIIPGTANWQIQVADRGFLLILLPPGAFLTFGCLIALSNWLSSRKQADSPALDDRIIASNRSATRFILRTPFFDDDDDNGAHAVSSDPQNGMKKDKR